MQKGSISVQTENIFPIIKKFLYSDHEIFLRELVANAVDATSKVKTLAKRGDVAGDLGDTHIEIILDKENKKLTIRDHGIGMTEEEVMKYLNQVAFSSAEEFLEKYKDDAEASIIGHFGLGFYSAFMVAEKVEVQTRSFKEGSKGVTWTCEGDPAYTLEDNDKETRGTDIILHVGDDALEFLETARIQGLLDKYCKFLPVEIRFEDKVVNNTSPAWRKQPAELDDEQYKNHYNELYPNSEPPLFWIHLNIDYPFNLTGILYFPKLSNNLEVQKNKIHLYSNQVYVTDEVKEIVPEFLTLLHGVIDSPDIPLNVSRSYLQSDSNVKKITDYITRKVADKLNSLFKSDRPQFEEKWEHMRIFVKYGMLSDEKFSDKAMKFVLINNENGDNFTIDEYMEKIKVNQTDKDGKHVVIYTNTPDDHDGLVEAAKEYGYDVLELTDVLDNHFMQRLESKVENVKFVRLDAEAIEKLVDKGETRESVLNEEQETSLKTYFEEEVSKDSGAVIVLEALSPDSMPVTITKPEFMRRMREMGAMQGMDLSMMPESYNVVVNTNHPLISGDILENEDAEKRGTMISHLYNIALLSQNMLKGAELSKFVQDSLKMLKK